MLPKVSLIARVLTALCLVQYAVGGVVNFEMNVHNARVAPSGVERSAVIANGQVSGPLITGNKGDRFLINVVNNLVDPSMHRSTAIHWHGFFQAGTAEMDGPAFITQCPIVPDHNFLYNFSVPGQAGTFWYHSHLSTQYCDGLRGPFVVYDPEDPLADLYDVDDESTVITLDDWYNGISTALFPNDGNEEPIPDATLVNGKGRSRNGGDLAVIRAQPGKRHRYRLVAASCLPAFKFSIDDHTLTVIEADGVEHEPVTVDSLTIHAGQRYSFIVNADQPVGNYWIRAIPTVPEDQTTSGGRNSAILRYDGAPDQEPTTTAKSRPNELNEADLHPLINPGAPGIPEPEKADVNLRLKIGHSSHVFEVNGTPFENPSIPVLLQILSGTTDPRGLLPAGSVYALPPNKTIEVNIPHQGPIPHPIHLHGHTFDVIRVAGSKEYNFKNPVRRDVVSIGEGGDDVTFRFFTDNPGPWFVHCHIDWHLENGLAVVFAEDVEGTPAANPPGQDWLDLCPTFNELNPDEAHGIP